MKSLISSNQADDQLSEIYLSFCEQDQLFEQLHTSLEYISRTSDQKFQQIPIKIDGLQIVLELEIGSQKILIAHVRVLGEWC